MIDGSYIKVHPNRDGVAPPQWCIFSPPLYLGFEVYDSLSKVCGVRQTDPPWVMEDRCQAWVAAPLSEQSPNSIRG